MRQTLSVLPATVPCALAPRRAVRGFTLVELVLVLVLLGILAVYAVPRMINTGDFYARGFHDQSLAYLRYAQKTAIAQRRTVCATLSSTSVGLQMASAAGSNTCSVDLLGPDGKIDATDNKPRLTARSGVSMSRVGGDQVPISFNFDALGQPVTTAATPVQAATQVLQVANVTRTITVEAGTGYVHD